MIPLSQIKPGIRYRVVQSDEPDRLAVGAMALIEPFERLGHKVIETPVRFGPELMWREIPAHVEIGRMERKIEEYRAIRKNEKSFEK